MRLQLLVILSIVFAFVILSPEKTQKNGFSSNTTSCTIKAINNKNDGLNTTFTYSLKNPFQAKKYFQLKEENFSVSNYNQRIILAINNLKSHQTRLVDKKLKFRQIEYFPTEKEDNLNFSL